MRWSGLKKRQGEQKMSINNSLYPIRLQRDQMYFNLGESRISITDFWVCAAFLCPASVCLCDSAAQDIFVIRKGGDQARVYQVCCRGAGTRRSVYSGCVEWSCKRKSFRLPDDSSEPKRNVLSSQPVAGSVSIQTAFEGISLRGGDCIL